MKIHIITIGEPKLPYAVIGWQEYLSRLKHYHQVRVTHLHDKYAKDDTKLFETAGQSYKVVLEIKGLQLDSQALARFLESRALEAREVSFMIGGPNGLPQTVIDSSDYKLGLSSLTLPHDLAMVTLGEALYRASTISSGHPYHR